MYCIKNKSVATYGKQGQLSQPPGEVTMSPIAIEDPDKTSSVEFIQFSSDVEFLHDRNITKHLMLDNTWY